MRGRRPKGMPKSPTYFGKPYRWYLGERWSRTGEEITSQLLNLCSAYEEDEFSQIDLGKLILPPPQRSDKHLTKLQKPGKDFKDTV